MIRSARLLRIPFTVRRRDRPRKAAETTASTRDDRLTEASSPNWHDLYRGRWPCCRVRQGAVICLAPHAISSLLCASPRGTRVAGQSVGTTSGSSTAGLRAIVLLDRHPEPARPMLPYLRSGAGRGSGPRGNDKGRGTRLILLPRQLPSAESYEPPPISARRLINADDRPKRLADRPVQHQVGDGIERGRRPIDDGERGAVAFRQFRKPGSRIHHKR
jgi:hypothetical protein